MRWSAGRSTNAFLRAVLGGMVGRMVLMLAAVVAGVLALGLPRLPLAFSLLSYFVVFLVMELSILHRRTTTPRPVRGRGHATMSALLLALLLQAAPAHAPEAVPSPAAAADPGGRGAGSATDDHADAPRPAAPEPRRPTPGTADPSTVIMHHVTDVPLAIGPRSRRGWCSRRSTSSSSCSPWRS